MTVHLPATTTQTMVVLDRIITPLGGGAVGQHFPKCLFSRVKYTNILRREFLSLARETVGPFKC